MPALFEIFKIKEQKYSTHSSRPWSTSSAMEQSGNWHLSLWVPTIPTSCRLHQQIPHSEKAQIDVSKEYHRAFQVHIFRVWMARHTGPCYAAEMFTNLMKEYTVNHITSSPHYPQSNGLAEKFVQIVKNLFHKAKEEGVDSNKYLMIYRNTL